jgi:hypothetical protein
MITRRGLLVLNLIWGVLSILVGIAGLYFVYKYAVAILAVDNEMRELLLGQWLANIIGDSELLLLVGASLYLAFRVMQLIIASATLENWAENELRAIHASESATR